MQIKDLKCLEATCVSQITKDEQRTGREGREGASMLWPTKRRSRHLSTVAQEHTLSMNSDQCHMDQDFIRYKLESLLSPWTLSHILKHQRPGLRT